MASGFFLSNAYVAHRPKPLEPYVDRMTFYLKQKHPHKSEEEIASFVRQVVKDRVRVPTIDFRHQPSEGNITRKQTSLTGFMTDILKQNIVLPSGAVYITPDKKESLLRITLAEKVAKRKKFKKIYLEAEEAGREAESKFYNGRQQAEKVFNNAISGAMNNGYNALTSKSGFNAITSGSRMCVKQGYSFIERAIIGNIYLPTISMAISYCLNHLRMAPEDYRAIFTKYKITIPTVEQLALYLLDNVRNYTRHGDEAYLVSYIKTLDDAERAYVFYAGNFNNLARFNDPLIRTIVDGCFLKELPDDLPDVSKADLGSLDGDVLAAITGTQYEYLGTDEKTGAVNNFYELLEQNALGAKKIIYCARVFTKVFTDHLDLFRCVFHQGTTFSKMIFQEKMARKVVPNSDTDSAIFSNQNIVEWKRGKLDFSKESYEMNAFMTLLLAHGIKHYLALLSQGFGFIGKDVFRINMKNEFLYPILVVSALAKHYIAIATIQEGKILLKLRKDVKGVQFRNSAYPQIIKDGFSKYIDTFFENVTQNVQIKPSDVLDDVVKMEHLIYDNLNSGNSSFLPNTTIKNKEEYDDPSKTSYFYYELWQTVFAPKFFDMTIPNKCYKIPLYGGKRFLKHKNLLERIKAFDAGVHDRLLSFCAMKGKTELAYILIPPITGEIPRLFLDIMDFRTTISSICVPYYRFIEALGIATANTDENVLVSDFYNPDLKDIPYSLE